MYVYVRVCLCIMKAAIDGEAEGCRNRISSKSHKQNAGMKAVLQCSHENTACTCVCVCVCVCACVWRGSKHIWDCCLYRCHTPYCGPRACDWEQMCVCRATFTECLYLYNYHLSTCVSLWVRQISSCATNWASSYWKVFVDRLWLSSSALKIPLDI